MAAPASGSRLGENADEEEALFCRGEDDTLFEELDIDTATLVRVQSPRRPLIDTRSLLPLNALPWSIEQNASCYPVVKNLRGCTVCCWSLFWQSGAVFRGGECVIEGFGYASKSRPDDTR